MPIETVYKNTDCEWLDVTKPNAEDLQFLHERYGINRFFLDDTQDPNHLPKYEENEHVKFFLLRENTELERKNLNSISDVSTKIGIFVLEKTIITIHRIKTKGILETQKIVSNGNEIYYPQKIAIILALLIMKSFDDEAIRLFETMDKIENEIFLKSTLESTEIRKLYRLKRKCGLNARVLNISSDAIAKFKQLKLDSSEVEDLKDKHKDVIADFDHMISQITNLISMSLALSDQKANQVMKVLAIYSIYFLPISFIASLYGMNFEYMPELKQPMGYFLVLLLMTSIVISTFIYVRKKKW